MFILETLPVVTEPLLYNTIYYTHIIEIFIFGLDRFNLCFGISNYSSLVGWLNIAT